MKTVFAATAILFIGFTATGAEARSDKLKPAENAMAANDVEGVPHILNDRPWAEMCPGNRDLCGAPRGTKDARRSS